MEHSHTLKPHDELNHSLHNDNPWEHELIGAHFTGCQGWHSANHVVFQIANVACLIAYLAPHGVFGSLLLHGGLLFGFLLFCTWAWVVLCAPDIFSWNFAFVLLNAVQVFFIMYRLKAIKFVPEIEEIYTNLFQPLKVSRKLVKKLTCTENATVLSMYPGECYATQGVTRTDRLGLLISGSVSVMSNNQFLHHIHEKQFLDSPEFESTTTGEEKYQVTIIAVGPCRYMLWQRDALQYLFIKEPYLATIMATLIGRDITNKLYALNERLKNRGSRIDVRLPSVTAMIPPGDSRRPSVFNRRIISMHQNQSYSTAITVADNPEELEDEDLFDELNEEGKPFPTKFTNGKPNNLNRITQIEV
ncbi:popeye domain-containing protein 3-like [Tubulanus polymorphus]|uniref:popeye domain-containing protein 3-like n=1 Tax=Tubulanus polymorphus TaxID=672921 RepID=UPI003DA46F52